MGSVRGRYAHVVLRKAGAVFTNRAGDFTEDKVGWVITVMQNLQQYKTSGWFLHRENHVEDGKCNQFLPYRLDNKLREDSE